MFTQNKIFMYTIKKWNLNNDFLKWCYILRNYLFLSINKIINHTMTNKSLNCKYIQLFYKINSYYFKNRLFLK